MSNFVYFYRRRKEREEISATGVIEVWGLSPREAPPEYVQCNLQMNQLYLCFIQLVQVLHFSIIVPYSFEI